MITSYVTFECLLLKVVKGFRLFFGNNEIFVPNEVMNKLFF